MARPIRRRRRSSQNQGGCRHYAAAGFTFYTIDPSDHVDRHADDYGEQALREKFAEIREFALWFESYANCEVACLLAGRSRSMNRPPCVVPLNTAARFTTRLNSPITLSKSMNAAGREFELELSIDETRQPTSLAEHYIIADQFRQHGLRLISVAPEIHRRF